MSSLNAFVILLIFSVLVLIYFAFGVFQSEINPLIKLLPFIAMNIYILIKLRVPPISDNWKKYAFKVTGVFMPLSPIAFKVL